MKKKKDLFIICDTNKNVKNNPPCQKEPFITVDAKRLNHIREVKIREGEQYTIEIDSENENDIKTNLDKNDKNLKNNNYPPK